MHMCIHSPRTYTHTHDTERVRDDTGHPTHMLIFHLPPVTSLYTILIQTPVILAIVEDSKDS